MDQLSEVPTKRQTLAGALERIPAKWRWRVAALVIVLVGVAIGTNYFLGGTETTYRTTQVTKGNIEQSVTALGSLEPKNYVDVGAQVSGTLEKVHVEIGDLVTKGQLLAEVDPTVYESTVAADRASLKDLEAQIKGQQAQLALAQIQNRRNQQLLKGNAVSKDTAETSAAQVKLYAANIDASKAQLEKAQSTLDGDLSTDR